MKSLARRLRGDRAQLALIVGVVLIGLVALGAATSGSEKHGTRNAHKQARTIASAGRVAKNEKLIARRLGVWFAVLDGSTLAAAKKDPSRCEHVSSDLWRCLAAGTNGEDRTIDPQRLGWWSVVGFDPQGSQPLHGTGELYLPGNDPLDADTRPYMDGVSLN